MKRQTHGALATLLIAVVGLLAGPVFADMENPAPEAVIQSSTAELISAIEEAKLYFDQDPDRFYDEVQGILDPVIDFTAFSRGVMAVHYKRANEDQRDRFVTNFRGALVRTYGKALLEFDNEKIEVMADERQSSKPDRRNVRMEVTMRYSDENGWRIRNIIVNGINIGLTYRNQFGSAMNNSDLDTVINTWAETVANVDPVAGEEGEGSAAPTPAEVSKS